MLLTPLDLLRYLDVDRGLELELQPDPGVACAPRIKLVIQAGRLSAQSSESMAPWSAGHCVTRDDTGGRHHVDDLADRRAAARHEARTHAPHAPAQYQLVSTTAFPMAALDVGMMHGMAGSSAMIVLSMGTVPSVGLGVLYILVFGLGSILGMAALTLAIILPARYYTFATAWLQGRLTLVVGAVGVGLGAMIMLENSAAWTALR